MDADLPCEVRRPRKCPLDDRPDKTRRSVSDERSARPLSEPEEVRNADFSRCCASCERTGECASEGEAGRHEDEDGAGRSK